MIYDKAFKKVGTFSLFSTEFHTEAFGSEFDSCWRSWDIFSSEMSRGNSENIVENPAGQFGLDHYVHVANDGRTSVVAESCGWERKYAYIYWMPGILATQADNFIPFTYKNPHRVLKIYDVNMDEDQFLKMVHGIAKSITVFDR